MFVKPSETASNGPSLRKVTVFK